MRHVVLIDDESGLGLGVVLLVAIVAITLPGGLKPRKTCRWRGPIRQVLAQRWMILRQSSQLWELLAEANSDGQPRQVLVPPIRVDPPSPGVFS